MDAPGTDSLDVTTCTALGNAERFVVMYGDRVRYDHARKRWLTWARHRWTPDADKQVVRYAAKCLRDARKVAGDGKQLTARSRE
jgi:hypothetical protein